MNELRAGSISAPSFKDIYGLGSLGLGSQATPEPDLRPGSALRIDGVNVPYEVATFSFQPNEDVSSIDTGFGLVTVAWPELESSGVLSFSLEDVPKADVGPLLSLLTETRRYRWLSFRGRRYRVSGFTADYAPDTHPRTYTFNVSCTAYRPHKSLPPVPGTEVYVVADVRRYGGVRHTDKLLYVGGSSADRLIITSGGLCLWNVETGARTLLHTDIDTAGSVSFYEGRFYVAYGAGGQTWVRRIKPGEAFSPVLRRLDVPFSERTHVLQGDNLYFVEQGVLKKLAFTQGRVTTVPAAPFGLRVNPLQTPLFLYEVDTEFGNTATRVPASVIGVGMSGEHRALAFKNDGLYQYHASIIRGRMRLDGPVQGPNGIPVKVASADSVQRFGLFGSAGMPEGYWLVENDVTTFAPYESVQASHEHPYYIGSGAHLAETAYGALVDGDEAVLDYAGGFNAAAMQSGPIPLGGFEGVLGARLTWGATLPPDTALIVSARVDSGPLNVLYRSDLDGPAESCPLTLPATGTGHTVTLHVQLIGSETSAPPRFGPLGLLVSLSASTFTDSDGDGYVEAPLTRKRARLQSVYSDAPVEWGGLRGVFYDGFGYYPYTDKHLYEVFPLI